MNTLVSALAWVNCVSSIIKAANTTNLVGRSVLEKSALLLTKIKGGATMRFSIKSLYRPACFAVLLALLLQGPAILFATPATPATPVPQDEQKDEFNFDGYQVTQKPTAEVNDFLGSNGQRARFLDLLASRGVEPEKVAYLRVSDDPASDADTELKQLTAVINNDVVRRCGGIEVSNVEMWIGGAQGAGGLDGEILLVANLKNGESRLIAGIQADENAMAARSEPLTVDGDMFASNGTAIIGGCPPQILVIIACWIQCIIIQRIIVLLHFIVVTIVTCVFTPPFVICVTTQVAFLCIIRIVIRIIFCFRVCVVRILQAAASPGSDTGPSQVADLAGSASNPTKLDARTAKPDKRLARRGRINATIPMTRRIPVAASAGF